METTTEFVTGVGLSQPDTTLLTESTAQAIPPDGGGGMNNDVGKAIGCLLAVLLVVIVLFYVFGGRR